MSRLALETLVRGRSESGKGLEKEGNLKCCFLLFFGDHDFCGFDYGFDIVAGFYV